MRMLVLTTAAIFAAAGCAEAQPPVTAAPEVGAAGECDATKAEALVGRAASEAEGEALRVTGARVTRVFEQGSPVTMDYRADRLNIETDAQGRIVRLRCG